MDSFFPACERIISFASGRTLLPTEAIHAAITALANAGMLKTSACWLALQKKQTFL